MRRLIPAFFVVVAMTLLAIFLVKKTVRKTNDVQQIENIWQENAGDQNTLPQENAVVSFTPLNSDETLLSSTGIDLDGDTFDDEIVVVRKNSSPHLILIVSLFNPQTASYDRVSEIRTEVSQLRSLSYNGMDVVGDHRIALVYQGFTDEGDSVLQMYFCKKSGLVNIGSFKSDGTIFIQQYARGDAYELSQSSERSFPVWVYASDTREGASNLSQVQTEYDWSEEVGRYVRTRQVFVEGKNIAAAELRKIQDGTVATFAEHLNGLWYMADGRGEQIHYIFFDYQNREVIFLAGDSQEVYKWQDSNLYRNGIHLSTVNISIENLRRRFDISLTGLNEMRVRVYDDVQMRIGTDAAWDGRYQKMDMKKTFFEESKVQKNLARLNEALEQVEKWNAADGVEIIFKNGVYEIRGEEENESGVYFASAQGERLVLQFNSRKKNSYFAEAYAVSFSEEKNALVLQPARILSNDVYEVPGKVVALVGD